MELLREWVLTLVGLLIFISFIEFLLPNSNHRRYINVILGLVIMLAMLKPVMDFLQTGQDLGNDIMQTTNQIDQLTLSHRIESGTISHEENIMKVYQDNLKTQMTTRIESQLGLEVADIILDVEQEEEGKIGSINQLTIVLKNPDETESIHKEGVQPVHVNVDLSGKSNTNTDTESISIVNERDDIQKDFSSFYNIAKDNITVSVQENR